MMVTPEATAIDMGGGKIMLHSWLRFDDPADTLRYSSMTQVSSALIDTENAAVRAALVKLGWTPPKADPHGT